MIDIGVNLTNSQLLKNADAILRRAQKAGVTQCIVTGTDIQASSQALQLTTKHAAEFPGMLYSTAGVHPHDASSWSRDTQRHLLDLLQEPSVVAVGETGLDFNRNFSTPDEQIRAFEAQLEIAATVRKPVFLHERQAFAKQEEMLRYHRDDIGDAVVHCFTGTKSELFAYLDLNFYVGITGWVCDERRGKDLADIVNNIPLDRLMVETDAPYLLPRNISPKPKSRVNEPAFLFWVVEKIAACYGESFDTIKRKTSQNAQRFFRLDCTNTATPENQAT